jgi:serine/threonine protein kinase/tetratricopeptide (TPR) repeat protein
VEIMSDRKVGRSHRNDEDAASEESSPTRAFGDPDAPGTETAAAFAPGEIVADRFRILRFIAQGGMGEVYEAEDQELRVRVALKTIRPEITGSELAMERFRREIQLSRRVTHPNVCRIFDVFRHVDSRSGSEVTFLTMELLNGETLAGRLQRLGRMTSQEARTIVEQVASALEAAHGAGVVHRDFKPQNVMLVDSDQGTRAVVTDFGLARGQLTGDQAESITGAGAIVGTPSYMAPEQLEGKDVTPAADLYALGLVMYEMVTGTRPFSGDSPLETAVKRLKEPPPSPISHAPNLERRWETAILRCLEREPARRFDSPSSLVRSLKASRTPTKRRFATVASGLAVLAVLAIVMLASVWTRREPTETPAAPSRHSIAVLGFKNLTGRTDASWLSTAFSEMLGTELAYGEQLRVIPGETVARMRVDLSLEEADSYAEDTLQRIRSSSNADFIVLGSYVAIGDGDSRRIRLDLRLQDTDAGETISAVSETGPEEELFEIVTRVGSGLRQSMGIEARTRGRTTVARVSFPKSTEAARLYANGLTMLRAFDYQGARSSLEQAIRIEPDYPLAHFALADVWSSLGFRGKAEDEARLAFELSGEFSREDRLIIEARYRSKAGEHDEAAETLHALVSLFPDRVDYRLRQAYVLLAASESDKALETIERLKGVPGADEDPRVDLAESWITGAVGDSERQLHAARRAVRKARARGARILLAQARLQESQLPSSEMDPAEAIQAAEESRGLYRDVGDRLGEAKALMRLADLSNDPEETRGLRGESVTLLQAIGANPEVVDEYR